MCDRFRMVRWLFISLNNNKCPSHGPQTFPVWPTPKSKTGTQPRCGDELLAKVATRFLRADETGAGLAVDSGFETRGKNDRQEDQRLQSWALLRGWREHSAWRGEAARRVDSTVIWRVSGELV